MLVKKKIAMNDAKVLAALLRRVFPAFNEKVFRTLTPGQIYIPNWHIAAIAWQLERIRRGEIKRLIINMPPRSLKSLTASVAFPAFVLGQDPTRRIICVSYSQDLTRKHANDFRAVLESAWYKALFPNTRIGRYKNTETEIELTERGFRLATSVGGTLTGRGGDIIIIDDPIKPDDAFSESKRTSVNQWFGNTLLSRLDDKVDGAIVVIMQRVHMDDLTGFLLENSNDWVILNLPAIAMVDERIQFSDKQFYFRKAGEALSPGREPIEILNKIRLQIGSDAFSAQYQQMPVPPGGAMVKRAWVRRYTEAPTRQDAMMILQSWDTASKGGPDNDLSVCTTWIITRDMKWYLVDVWRERVDYPRLKAKVIELAQVWQPHRIVVEDASTGTALVAELQHQLMGIAAIKPEHDKAARMAVASAKIEAGQVLLPERASWLPEFEAELFSFPGSKHDDQCDSVSQALLDENNNSLFSWLRLAANI